MTSAERTEFSQLERAAAQSQLEIIEAQTKLAAAQNGNNGSLGKLLHHHDRCIRIEISISSPCACLVLTSFLSASPLCPFVLFCVTQALRLQISLLKWR